MKIGFIYNVMHDMRGGLSSELDFDSPETIRRICEAIKAAGHEVVEIEADEKAYERLSELRGQIDLVFNIAEGLRGDARESQVPLFCEMLDIPYTHSTPTTHAVSLNKHLAKLVAAGAGLTVPKGVIWPEKGDLRYPVIIKPNAEGSSIGVFDANVVATPQDLEERVRALREMGIKGDLLIEEYIDGREFTVAVWGNKEIEVLPVIEQNFGILPIGMHKIAGYELKWDYEEKLTNLADAYTCPPDLPPEKLSELQNLTKKVYRAMQVRDCARVDFRMDKDGRYYFLEINTLPGLNIYEKTISYFPLATRVAGWSGEQVIKRIIDMARERYDVLV